MSFLSITFIIINRNSEFVNTFFRIYEILLKITNFGVVKLYNKTDFFKKIELFGISNKDLAEAIEVSPGNVGDWKSGRSKPNIDAIVKIADCFNVTTDYLLGRKETKKEPTIIPYSGNERVDSIADKILKTDLTEDDLNLIEFILDKYKK